MNEEKPRKLSRLYFRQEQAVQQQSEGSTKKISRLVARQEESNSRLYFRQSGSEHLPASPIISGIDILTKQGVVDRTLGMTIVGQTGMGKSSLLQHIILSDIEAGVTNIVFDAHGDLTQDIVASLPLKFSKNMFVLAVDSDFPFGLNMYETTSRSPVARDRTVANVIDIFKKLWREERQFYPTLEHILRSTARMLLDNPDYSMAEIPKMFSNTKFRHHLLANVTNPAVHDFWQEYDSLRSFEQTQMLSSTRNRLNQFLSSELVQLIVSQEKTTIPFTDLLSSPGNTLFVYLPIGQLGESVTMFLGSMLLSILSNHIYERSRVNRPRVHLYLDEYQRFATPTTAALLREGRKFNLGTTVALQSLQTLDEENRVAALQTGTLVCFQVIGGLDAQLLAKQMSITPTPTEQVQKMRMRPNYNKWATYEWTDEKKEQEAEFWKQKNSEADARLEGAEIARKEIESCYRGYWIYSNPLQYLAGAIRERIKNYRISLEKGECPHHDPTPFFQMFLTEWEKVYPLLSEGQRRDWLYQKFEELETFIAENKAVAQEAYQKYQELCNLYFERKEHCEQDGWLPVRLSYEVETVTKRPNYSRYGPREIEQVSTTTREVQLYDMVDGTRRTYADMQNELETKLATLPRFTCYCQYLDETGHQQEMQITTPPPPQSVNNQYTVGDILEQSRQQFGRPAEEIRKRANDRIAPFLTKPEEQEEKPPAEEKPKPKNPPKPTQQIKRSRPYTDKSV